MGKSLNPCIFLALGRIEALFFLNVSGVYWASRLYKNICSEPFIAEVIRAERVAQ